MPKLGFKAIGGKTAKIVNLSKIARSELEAMMKDVIQPALIQAHERVVQDWETDVAFTGTIVSESDRIVLTVGPTGDGADIYKFVDQGTRPHTITPKSAPRLAFQAGTYIPKTKPIGQIVSGGGQVQGGELVFAKQVNHPGTKARQFSETIAEDIGTDFQREAENAFQRIAQGVDNG